MYIYVNRTSRDTLHALKHFRKYNVSTTICTGVKALLIDVLTVEHVAASRLNTYHFHRVQKVLTKHLLKKCV